MIKFSWVSTSKSVSHNTAEMANLKEPHLKIRDSADTSAAGIPVIKTVSKLETQDAFAFHPTM